MHYIVVELFLRLNIVARDNRRPRVSYRNNGGAKLHLPPPSPFFLNEEKERERGVGISGDRILIGRNAQKLILIGAEFFFKENTKAIASH